MQRGFSLVLILVVLSILSVIGAGSFYLFNRQQLTAINSFEECAKKYPVLESYPAQCNTSDGRHFVQQINEVEKKQLLSPSESSATSTFKASNDKKIFRDTGIEFSYPSTWIYKKYDNEIIKYVVLGPPTEVNHIGEKVPPYPGNYLVFQLYPIELNQPIEQTIGLSKDMITKYEDVKVAGRNVTKLTHMGCVSGECITIVFPTEKMLYTFSIENSNNPEFSENLKEITNTVKFIN